jgi:uncharacterized protein
MPKITGRAHKPRKGKKSASGKVYRGFASLSPAKQRWIASLGGKAVHELGLGRKFQRGRDAQNSGRKGGIAKATNLLMLAMLEDAAGLPHSRPVSLL